MRIVAVLLAAIALAAAAAAVLALLAGPAGADLGTLWHRLAPESLNLVQAVTQRYLHPGLWTRAILPVLLMPAVGVFSVTAALATLLFLATLLLNRRTTK